MLDSSGTDANDSAKRYPAIISNAEVAPPLAIDDVAGSGVEVVMGNVVVVNIVVALVVVVVVVGGGGVVVVVVVVVVGGGGVVVVVVVVVVVGGGGGVAESTGGATIDNSPNKVIKAIPRNIFEVEMV